MTALLQSLTDDGFAAGVRGAHLLVHDVPYVTSAGTVARATLAFVLEPMAGSGAVVSDHKALWTGEFPCRRDGSRMADIECAAQNVDLGDGVVVRYVFSSKPPRGHYVDQHEQVTTYVSIIANEARALDPSATPRTRRPVVPAGAASPFVYVDSATARTRIDAVSRKLELAAVGIVGLGGTGAYVLDLIAKTPVRRIVTVDGDVMEQHNAFRAPGAVPLDALRRRPFKVDYWREVYSHMHRGIEAVPSHLDETNAHLLDELDFAFLCMDPGPGKRLAVERMERLAIPFVDCGMGLEHVEEVDGILGIVRVTASLPGSRGHVRARLGLDAGREDDLYARNIQVADLNALNAALAVIRFKRFFGFYIDLQGECHATYGVDLNRILNEDRPLPKAANLDGGSDRGRAA